VIGSDSPSGLTVRNTLPSRSRISKSPELNVRFAEKPRVASGPGRKSSRSLIRPISRPVIVASPPLSGWRTKTARSFPGVSSSPKKACSVVRVSRVKISSSIDLLKTATEIRLLVCLPQSGPVFELVPAPVCLQTATRLMPIVTPAFSPNRAMLFKRGTAVRVPAEDNGALLPQMAVFSRSAGRAPAWRRPWRPGCLRRAGAAAFPPFVGPHRRRTCPTGRIKALTGRARRRSRSGSHQQAQ
jgi:hypothetical protein